MNNAHTVEHHGTSGTWYPLHGPASSLQDAIVIASELKRQGYGVRILDNNGAIVISAPWQEEMPVMPR